MKTLNILLNPDAAPAALARRPLDAIYLDSLSLLGLFMKLISSGDAIRHLEDVISQYNAMDERTSSISQVEQLYVRLRAAVFRHSPPDSEYEKEAHAILGHTKGGIWGQIKPLIGVAQSLKQDYEGGFISASFAALVRAELFADFLDMAQHLLESGYKDPSAVLVGAVLEEHLRKLCIVNHIALLDRNKPRKAEALNADLAGKSVYTKLDQKSVTAWQDLRNKAAHGQFSAYTDAQVDLMHMGVRDFVSRLPA